MKIRTNSALLFVALLIPTVAIVIALAAYDLGGKVSSDSNLYLYVGNSFWSGSGLLDIDGKLFAAHGPLFPIALSMINNIGGIPLMQLLTIACLWAAMIIAVYVSYRLAGGAAALVASAVVLLPTVFWVEITKVSIDHIQALLVMLFVLALMKQKTSNFVAAGVAFAIMLLTKETAALLFFAPLAFYSKSKAREFWKKYSLFALVSAAIAGWWWIAVWQSRHVIFPMQQFAKTDVGINTLPLSVYALLAIMTLSLIAYSLYLKNNPRGRLVFFSALALLPPTLLSAIKQMDERQFIIYFLLVSIVFAAFVTSALGEKKALVGSLVLLPIIFVFPTHLDKPRVLVRPSSTDIVSSYVKQRVLETGENRVIIGYSDSSGGMRSIALQSEIATFPKPVDFTDCRPCRPKALAKTKFFERLYGPENTLVILQRSALNKALQTTPGFTLIWSSSDSRIAVFAINRKTLPNKNRLRQIVFSKLPE